MIENTSRFCVGARSDKRAGLFLQPRSLTKANKAIARLIRETIVPTIKAFEGERRYGSV